MSSVFIWWQWDYMLLIAVIFYFMKFSWCWQTQGNHTLFVDLLFFAQAPPFLQLAVSIHSISITFFVGDTVFSIVKPWCHRYSWTRITYRRSSKFIQSYWITHLSASASTVVLCIPSVNSIHFVPFSYIYLLTSEINETSRPSHTHFVMPLTGISENLVEISEHFEPRKFRVHLYRDWNIFRSMTYRCIVQSIGKAYHHIWKWVLLMSKDLW